MTKIKCRCIVAANSYFIGSAANMTLKLTGNPTFMVNDVVANKGFNFYLNGSSINDGKTGTFLGYAGSYNDNSGNVIVDKTVAAGKITKGFAVKYTTLDSNDFDMQDGAAIRTAENENGIRFSTFVSDKLLEIVGDKATFGTIIVNKEMLDGAGLDITLDNAILKGDTPIGRNFVAKRSRLQAEGEGKVFRAAIVGISDTAADYTKEFGARAYMTVTYADGTTKTFYTAFDDNNVRSIHTVAENLYSKHTDLNDSYTMSEDTLSVVNKIINTVG